jgi:RNA polymerase sigma-70 factor (ECF subfamily)
MDGLRISVNELAQACAHSADAAEWEELLRRSTPLVSLVALRVSRMWKYETSLAVVDDIVQEVFLKLCEQERRILREFAPRGEDSFLGLLRIVSASVANDYHRRLHAAKRGGKVVTEDFDEDALAAPGSNGRETEAMHKSVLLAQLDEKLKAAPGVISPRDRDLFWLYYLQGLTAEEIAALPAVGLTAKGVESALRRIAKWLREETGSQSPEQKSGGIPHK